MCVAGAAITWNMLIQGGRQHVSVVGADTGPGPFLQHQRNVMRALVATSTHRQKLLKPYKTHLWSAVPACGGRRTVSNALTFGSTFKLSLVAGL